MMAQFLDIPSLALQTSCGGELKTAKESAALVEGGTIVGKNAPEALRGRTLRIPTQEWRVP
jgi:hypothetical protein